MDGHRRISATTLVPPPILSGASIVLEQLPRVDLETFRNSGNVIDRENAQSPEQAAAFVLNAIYSRQVSVLPALQPAASELR
jgi:hypothetical protein